MTSSAVPDLDRSLVFERVFNVRDLGGLPTADGGRTRTGRAFRADGVHRLAGADLDVVRALELRTVLDLRTVGEVEHRGTFPAGDLGAEWHHLPLIERPWSQDSLRAASTATEFLAERYLAMLESGGSSIARAVQLVADAGPVLFHCAAGKDRTGVLAAVLLGLVGVDDDVIAADYHLSAQAMDALRDWLMTEYPEAKDAMTNQPPEYLECPPEAMLAFLAGVAERHGSMLGLVRELGVDESTVARLRAVLVER